MNQTLDDRVDLTKVIVCRCWPRIVYTVRIQSRAESVSGFVLRLFSAYGPHNKVVSYFMLAHYKVPAGVLCYVIHQFVPKAFKLLP
jgi:hypothetical protein